MFLFEIFRKFSGEDDSGFWFRCRSEVLRATVDLTILEVEDEVDMAINFFFKFKICTTYQKK